MNKHLKVSLFLLGASTLIRADNATDHTTYWVRPQFQSAMPEKVTMFRDRALARDCGWGGAFQAVVFGGQTLNSKSLAKFFTFGDKDALHVQTSDTADLGSGIGRDINPLHFGIAFCNPTTNPTGTFSSTIQFRPRQKTIGVGFEWKQYLGWWNDCCERKWWFDISFPVIHVRNEMRMTETGITATGTLCPGAFPNMTTAFAGTSDNSTELVNLDGDVISICTPQRFNFGRIDDDAKAMKKTTVADIELKLGYDYVNEPTHHLDGYIGALIPTGNKNKGVYVFEAIVGHGKHWGFMTGGSMGFEIWTGCNNNSLRWEFETNARYLFRNTQVRSFNLRYRPWSRYLLIFANADDAANECASFGINTFTQPVRVHPHWQFNMNTGFVYNHCGFEGEVGWNVWARQEERVKLKTPWVVGPAVVDLNTISEINLLSNIANDNAGASVVDNTAHQIQAGDLDLASAAHPAALSNIVYGSLGWNFDWCWPMFVGVGASYEFSTFNTAVNRWTAWGKFGVSF